MTEFKLLQTLSARQRIYQLPFRCRVFPNCSDVVELLKTDISQLRSNCIVAEDFSNGIDKVCISDAHMYIERLVFPAFFVKDMTTKEIKITFTMSHVAGNQTFMIHGGDVYSIREYEEYLQEIIDLNKH